jgi:hypothetical protein
MGVIWKRATRMSSSVPIVPPRSSVDLHTVTQFPRRSVVTHGYASLPPSDAAFMLRATAEVHVAPLSVLRETKMWVRDSLGGLGIARSGVPIPFPPPVLRQP